jgi:hypothetical protein
VTGPSSKIPSELVIYASQETIRQEAQGLLGCADQDANKVNAMQKFDDGHAVCVSNGNGCSGERWPIRLCMPRADSRLLR